MAGVSHAPLILITGGSRGVGAATARLAAAQGYDVAISFVADEAAAQAVLADVRAAGRRGLAVRADSADPHQVGELFGAIDQVFAGSTCWSTTPRSSRRSRALNTLT
jgi:NAD(P)-dependent dehydrogenase (short-subunit alcohol dehydrogenase family)